MRLLHPTAVGHMTAEQRTFVDQAFAAGLEEGAFPSHRAAPEGDEDIVLAVMDVADLVGTRVEYVGFASYYVPGHMPLVWLDLLYVEPAFRRQSVATRLVASVMAAAQRDGLPFECGTLMSNAAMQALAVSLGLEGRSLVYRKEPV